MSAHSLTAALSLKVMQRTPQPRIARSMSLLLGGTALHAIDVPLRFGSEETVDWVGGAPSVQAAGFLIDLFPDELGAVLLALAFLGLLRNASGALRGCFVLLIALQALALIAALGAHSPQEAVVQEGFTFDWRGSVGSGTALIAGWSLAALAGQLEFTTSRWRWRRFAVWATLGEAALLAGIAVLGYIASTSAEIHPSWAAAATGLAGLGFVLMVFLGYLGLAASLAMRAEAMAP